MTKVNKIIHYCWFGKGEKSELIKKCIKSWKHYLPDYRIIEWNEENFDIYNNVYTKEAYENKKWAFVSDYVRLFAIYNYGGIYLDTDVEITRNLDDFLMYPAFLGFHNNDTILTALIGAQINNPFIKELLNLYDEKHFLKDGNIDMQINNELLTEFLVNNCNLILNNANQILNKNIYVFSSGYFSKVEEQCENYSIHHGEGSWYTLEKAMNELKSYKEYYFCLLNLFKQQLKNKKLKNDLFDGNVAVYGNGEMGHMLIDILKVEGIKPICIIDRNKNVNAYQDIPLIEIKDINNYKLDYIIITPIVYLQEIIKDIRNENNMVNLIEINDIYEV